MDAGELAQGEVVTVSPGDSAEQVMATMEQHKIRRIPVAREQDLVGIVAQADVARSLQNQEAGEVVKNISHDG